MVSFFVIVLFLILTSILLINPSNAPDKKTISPPAPIPTINPEKDYSSLNKIIPGKSSIEDVKRLNGDPDSTSTEKDRIFLYYKTPLEGFTNRVLVEKNIVVYSIENVFGSYRGSVESFNSSYGAPDLSLFDKENNYSWYVYLKQGVAIENDGKDIGTVLYFIPQEKEEFMSTLAIDLGLTDTPTIEE